MRKIQLAVLPVVVGALLACGGATSGGGTGGTGSVSGTVASTTFDVASEIAVIQPANSDSSCTEESDGGETCVETRSGQEVTILFTNRAAVTCALVQSDLSSSADLNFANFDIFGFNVFNDTGDVPAGTYAVVAPSAGGATSGVIGSFQTSTSTCAEGLQLSASSGSVTLTQVSSTGVAGSYSVTFGAQGTYSGAFNIPICDLPDAGNGPPPETDGGQPICQP